MALKSNLPVQPQRYGYRVKVMRVTKINDFDETFTADFFLHLDWVDEKALEYDLGVLDSDTFKLASPPPWKLKNAISVDNVEPVTYRVVEKRPQGAVVVMSAHLIGEFYFRKAITQFPFDSHRLIIKLDMKLTDDKAVFEPTELENVWKVIASMQKEGTEWQFAPAEIWHGSVPEPSGKRAWSNLDIIIPISRYHDYYTSNTVGPFTALLGICTIVFWMDPDDLGDRVGLVSNLMLAAFAAKFVLASHLPRVPYMTELDKYIYGAYFLFTVAAFESVVVKHISLYREIVDTVGFCVFVILGVLLNLRYLRFIWYSPHHEVAVASDPPGASSRSPESRPLMLTPASPHVQE